ncbi:MAG: two-component system, sensor histidine kinase and response regulator [Pseudomonadota bacterium]|nr:two-component system, sensor histidine kinase and response regulator [Pseudomonadota bacterium]
MTQVSDDSGMHGPAGLSPDIFRRLADASTDGIGMARLDSRIIYANATLLRLLGLSDASAVVEHSFFDYFPPDEAARLRDEIIPQVQATGEWTGELKLVSGSDRVWHTIQNIFLIRDEHGAPAAFANVITDITERACATESLRVSQAAIDSSINAIAMSSLEGKLTYVNQAFVDLWQLDSAADALGRSPLDFWARSQQAQAVMEALRQEGRWQGELEARRRDGSSVELELSAHMVRDSSGQPACMMSWFVDVSAHKHVQRELLRSQAFLTSIIRHIPAVVFIKRASDLRFELFNRAGEELLGHDEAEVLGKTDHDLFPPEQADFFVATDREVLASGVPLDIAEEPVQARNGEIRIMHTRKSGIYNAAGEQTHLLGIAVDITDRKHAEALLKQQRDFATGLVDTAPVIILVLDPNGLVEYVNPYFERLSGYRIEDLKGREWFDSCLPARDRDRIRELFRQASHDTLKPGNVNPIVTRDGKERDIEWSNQALRDADGNLVSLLAIGLDVTDRQRNEERTRISEMRLNEAQRIAKVGSWELELESDTLIWTDEIFTLFEIDKSRFDASYGAFLDSIHPEDRDIVNAAYVQSLSDRRPYVITHRLRMADGRIKWVEERCETEFDADGKPLRSHGTVQDITERWKLEEALIKLNMELEQRVMERTAEMEAQNIRNASIINAAMDGFFIADLTGRMIDVNDIYCSMLGYDRAEFLALTIPDIEANERPEDVVAHIETILGAGEDRFDTRHRRKDGSLLDVEVNVTLLDLGNERLFYAFVHDITPRKAAESALIRARDEAERANLAKTEFLSRMSHELRTPMNAILGFAQLLEAEPLEEAQTGSVREILQAGRHLLEMINEVLDLSRIESGHLGISRSKRWPVNPSRNPVSPRSGRWPPSTASP